MSVSNAELSPRFASVSDAEEVAECADRVLVMRRGALVSELPAGLDHLDDIYAACYAAGGDAAPEPSIREENDR